MNTADLTYIYIMCEWNDLKDQILNWRRALLRTSLLIDSLPFGWEPVKSISNILEEKGMNDKERC